MITATAMEDEMTQRPGPKRDDPLRIAALKENARRQMEAEFMEQCKVLKRSGEKATDLVRATRDGRRPQAGVIVSETADGTMWVLKLANGRLTEYLKSHCEKLRGNEAGKGIRKIRKEWLNGAYDQPEGVVGINPDGDDFD